ncbi:hypothetical protein CEN49_01130 [Fischerella thermalis CCMEE 5273]|uniref:Uncharacterized protein n=4 Tax=Fischerella TaxID=1190 RepID=A0A2N6LJX7_9CYAN|nr:hypothetical protein NIES592_19545 [Fischerella major NIES-592]PLZ08172.1 hypothetical protein CBP19_17735 [Fischerella thermalis WC1110]PLZ08682.1 hypothetical protein CBP18_13180 [Fischerella thermalis WC119]PLZ09636.1 hypothetical protein CBP17_12155 [Fischerella thermalis WC114]PLZ19522.1 hypothetical protein CBP30_14435 [Fischerella thermalis WC157]PLZ26148.1 hypothetical protein CBP29_06910 [Fischerella thermalis WC341]PLZ27575.1 hypothetical protein CBP28_12940 [Fischerella thermali
MDSKEVFVKAHTRIIRQRVYRFVCKGCNLVVERTCYPSRPLFCERCRPPKHHPPQPQSKTELKVTRGKSKTAKKPIKQRKRG